MIPVPMYVRSRVPVRANLLFHVPRSAVISNGQQINSATGNVPQRRQVSAIIFHSQKLSNKRKNGIANF